MNLVPPSSLFLFFSLNVKTSVWRTFKPIEVMIFGSPETIGKPNVLIQISNLRTRPSVRKIHCLCGLILHPSGHVSCMVQKESKHVLIGGFDVVYNERYRVGTGCGRMRSFIQTGFLPFR